MEPRLIDANEPYEKIAARLAQLRTQCGVPRQCLEELANALDEIEAAKTIAWGGKEEHHGPQKL